jgi:UTP--glucose-1-phosphate uridylyltransferase
MQNKPVRKAVIAAAGFGTRFLPQTKAMPKEMLPLIDKPIIQYIVEELVEAGIQDIIIVTGYHKRSIEDHFDRMSADLRANLEQGGKHALLEATERISDMANFVYIRQKGPYGNGTPVLNAEHLIGDEPFIYTFADDFFVARPSRFTQMVQKYEAFGASILPCIRMQHDEDYQRYGIVDGAVVEPGVIEMNTIVEKPGKQDAPSDLGSVTGYLLTPEIFTFLHEAKSALTAGQEFYIQYGMQRMIDAGHKMYAFEVQDGKYYDTGNKLDYLKTVMDFGLKHEELGDHLRSYMRHLLED